MSPMVTGCLTALGDSAAQSRETLSRRSDVKECQRYGKQQTCHMQQYVAMTK